MMQQIPLIMQFMRQIRLKRKYLKSMRAKLYHERDKQIKIHREWNALLFRFRFSAESRIVFPVYMNFLRTNHNDIRF